MFIATKTVTGPVHLNKDGAVVYAQKEVSSTLSVRILKEQLYVDSEDQLADAQERQRITRSNKNVILFPYGSKVKKHFEMRGLLVEGEIIPADGAITTIGDIRADSQTEGDTEVETGAAVGDNAGSNDTNPNAGSNDTNPNAGSNEQNDNLDDL